MQDIEMSGRYFVESLTLKNFNYKTVSFLEKKMGFSSHALTEWLQSLGTSFNSSSISKGG